MELAKRIRPVSSAEAQASFRQLVALDCRTDPGMQRAGLKTLDRFFFGHRLKAKTKHHISFTDAMADPALTAKLHELVKRYKKRTPASYTSPAALLRDMYSVFQLYYGTINQFRPATAKWAYCTLGARRGILDFSAGWGGRALAAAALGIPYYGFDTNTQLRGAYANMLEMVERVQPDVHIKMRFEPSETADFSAFRYDLVFTSPPYFMLEEYERMPVYGSKAAFLERFFFPVVAKAWRYLEPGGHMALNMPEEMYVALKDHGDLPPLTRTLKMPIYNRHPTNASKRQRFGKENTERYELIYVWRKPVQGQGQRQRQTRRNQKALRKATKKMRRK